MSQKGEKEQKDAERKEGTEHRMVQKAQKAVSDSLQEPQKGQKAKERRNDAERSEGKIAQKGRRKGHPVLCGGVILGWFLGWAVGAGASVCAETSDGIKGCCQVFNFTGV